MFCTPFLYQRPEYMSVAIPKQKFLFFPFYIPAFGLYILLSCSFSYRFNKKDTITQKSETIVAALALSSFVFDFTMEGQGYSGKVVVVLVGVTFCVGFYLGYRAKAVRVRYLQSKRDRLINKLNQTTEDIRNAVATWSKKDNSNHGQYTMLKLTEP